MQPDDRSASAVVCTKNTDASRCYRGEHATILLPPHACMHTRQHRANGYYQGRCSQSLIPLDSGKCHRSEVRSAKDGFDCTRPLTLANKWATNWHRFGICTRLIDKSNRGWPATTRFGHTRKVYAGFKWLIHVPGIVVSIVCLLHILHPTWWILLFER